MDSKINTHGDVRAWTPTSTKVKAADGATIDYVWSKEARLAVQVALVTGRALLLRGEPGIGKTTRAEAVAADLNWRYYRHTTTSRTEASNALWHFDVVKRLADAQLGTDHLRADVAYVEPREFWWAFDRASAFRRGATEAEIGIPPAEEPNADVNRHRSNLNAVVLVDEIDKADPSVANDMLELLAERRFRVEDITPSRPIAWQGADGDLAPLLVLTTNEERDLPEAFLRRCIVHTMKWPSDAAENPEKQTQARDHILQIVASHWATLGGVWDEAARGTANLLVDRIEGERHSARERGSRKPGLAELIDAVRAIHRFGITTSDPLWDDVLRLVWRKSPDEQEI